MKFSVLLSLYYKESPLYLHQSLESVFNQTLRPTEVVLVKDGPLTDELNHVVDEYTAKYPEIKLVSLAQNVGLGRALNEGLKKCSYDLVARMDTDDICKPQRFEKQVGFFEKHPDIDVVGAWIDEFQQDIINVISTRKLPETHREIELFGHKRNPINHPVVMFRKEMVKAVNSYQPFYLFEDYYLWVRMLLNGAKFYNIQESLLYFRFSPDMIKRRGGIKYAYVEAKFQWVLYKLGYISFAKSVINTGLRSGTRIIPNGLRGWLYKNLLRK